MEISKKLVANLYGKTKCVIHTGNLKQALNHGLFLKKFHRMVKFYQNAVLKPYIVCTQVYGKKANYFEKDFINLMNYARFGETIGNVRKHRDIKLATTERRNYLVSD